MMRRVLRAVVRRRHQVNSACDHRWFAAVVCRLFAVRRRLHLQHRVLHSRHIEAQQQASRQLRIRNQLLLQQLSTLALI
jgi:hypothetical protein